MRFLLINPYYPISETPSPPLGLAFLAAALEQKGVEVKILDLVVFPYGKNALESVLSNFPPHFVGITSVTMTFPKAVNVLKDVKGIDPHILTVMGGPHVTFCAEDTMQALPELDFIVLGEGEQTIVDLVLEAGKGRNWDHIKGLVYRQGSEIRSTGTRKPEFDLDSLPLPARHLLPLGRYRALGLPISMTTSRGCPFQCIFCVGRRMVGPKVRYRDPRKVVDELEDLSSLNFYQINIADDLFTANEGHCLAICNEVIRRNLNVKWASFSRVDTITRKGLAKMKEAGCHTISFGIETANPGILKTIKKGITIKQVISAINMCIEVGITPHTSFILGLPGETPETLKETVDFAKSLKDVGVSYGFHLLAPFPGTEIREECDRFGIQILTNDWAQYHANRAIVATPTVGAEMLDEIVLEWERKFDEWLEEIKGRMGRGIATDEEARLLTNLEHTVLTYELMMGEAIEAKGFWRSNGIPIPEGDLLKTLVDRIERSTDHTREQVNTILNSALEQGNLRWSEVKDQIRWEWIDFL